jgi:hypothetical protein
MVVNKIDTNGTVNKITFKMVNSPLALLSSKPKALQDNRLKTMV